MALLLDSLDEKPRPPLCPMYVKHEQTSWNISWHIYTHIDAFYRD